ncbi:MAG TPA: hypothetical protein VMW38_03790, partial [Terriglobia bacterium]|nr:hypothetical protein [Terriglobia bacterium]
MKKILLMTFAALFVVSISAQEVMSRGFGGGGGRGAGGGFGGYRSGGAAYRSPSMSRPSSARVSSYQPSRQVSRQAPPRQQFTPRPATGTMPGQGAVGKLDRTATTRPTQGQLQQFLNLPQNQRPGRASDLSKIGAGAVAGALGVEG